MDFDLTVLGYDLSIVFEKFHLFLPAAWQTIKITVVAILIGVVIGLITALGRLSKYKLINLPFSLYITLIRGTPILVQLFIIYYGLTRIIVFDDFTSAAIAFGVHNGAYIAEIFRGAISSIDKGQMEAARSIGMTKYQAMVIVVLPQAFKRAVPPLGNQFIIATKDSSLAMTISITELLAKAQQLGASTYKQFEYLLIAAIYYLIFTTFMSVLLHKLERRLAVSDR